MRHLLCTIAFGVCLTSCVASKSQSRFGGYTLDFLGNMEPEFVTSVEAPVEYGKTFANDGGLSTGVWHCSRASWNWPSYPVHEVIELLDGEIVITWNDGKDKTALRRGEHLFVPKGAGISWENTGDVLKKYLIVEELPSSLLQLPNEPHIISDVGMIELLQRDYFRQIRPDFPT